MVQARWTLGHIPSERVPAIAQAALEAGVDVPALRMLAGESKPVLSEVAPLFERAFRELGYAPLTRESAGWIIALWWAGAILRGDVSPYEGARAIASEVCDPLGGGGRTFVFKRLASLHEDYRFARESAPPGTYDSSLRECEQEIVAEAKSLIAGSRG